MVPGSVFIGGKNAGWGGRDRTCESRDQNPLPYHLATPQSSAAKTYRITCPLCNVRLQICENESVPQPSLRSRINRPNNRNCEICRPGSRRGRLKNTLCHRGGRSFTPARRRRRAAGRDVIDGRACPFPDGRRKAGPGAGILVGTTQTAFRPGRGQHHPQTCELRHYESAARPWHVVPVRSSRSEGSGADRHLV